MHSEELRDAPRLGMHVYMQNLTCSDSFMVAFAVKTSDVSEVVQKGAKRFVRVTIIAGYKLCSCPLGRLGGH